MPAVAMIIWLGVSPAQIQSVQAQDTRVYRQNMLQQQEQQQPHPPPRTNNQLPNSMR